MRRSKKQDVLWENVRWAPNNLNEYNHPILWKC